jgi:hypothetical protein
MAGPRSILAEQAMQAIILLFFGMELELAWLWPLTGPATATAAVPVSKSLLSHPCRHLQIQVSEQSKSCMNFVLFRFYPTYIPIDEKAKKGSKGQSLLH